MISKGLRTLLPIYAIRVSIIQELRCTPSNDLTLDSLIVKIVAFELSNFDTYSPSSVECPLKSQLTLDGSKSKKMIKYVDNDSESDDDLVDLEVLLARRLSRGKGKYKGKLPIIYFTCNKIGHIVARSPNRDYKEEMKDRKY